MIDDDLDRAERRQMPQHGGIAPVQQLLQRAVMRREIAAVAVDHGPAVLGGAIQRDEIAARRSCGSFEPDTARVMRRGRACRRRHATTSGVRPGFEQQHAGEQPDERLRSAGHRSTT